MHWVKSSRRETYEAYIHRIYQDQLRKEIQLAVPLHMPKSVKLLDDDSRELQGFIRRKGSILRPIMVIEFDSEGEAKEFQMTVRNDPIKLCKAVFDVFSEQKLLESYQPIHKPKVALIAPEEEKDEQKS